MRPFALVPCVLAAFAMGEVPARAAEHDGLYGRLDGDVRVSFAGGVEWDADGPWAASLIRALYLDTVGPYVAFDQAFTANRAFTRTLSTGLSFRPLLLPRWGTDLERGPSQLDLTLDSLTIDLGALWAGGPSSHATFGTPGVELGLGFGIPLSRTDGGFWIGCRGVLRYTAEETARANVPSIGPIAALTLGWHQGIATHLVDASDDRSP